jgi:type 1 fimbria pilin
MNSRKKFLKSILGLVGFSLITKEALAAKETLTITGPLFLLPETIVFDNLLLNDQQVRTLSIENIGDGNLEISEITMPEDFEIDRSEVSLSAGSSIDLTITFTPTQVKNYEGVMIISSNEGNKEVKITGSGLLISSINDAYLAAYDIRIYPTPAYDLLNIDLSQTPISETVFKLVNSQGQLLWQQQGGIDRQLSIDVSTYPSGIYFLYVETNKGILVKKVMIKK